MTQAGRNTALSLVFDALADQTRRSIIQQLQRGPTTLTALAKPYDMSLNAVSKHLKKLERAGFIQKEIRGRERHCRLRPSALNEAMSWMRHHDRFWTTRIDALEQHLIGKRTRKRKP